ncbi:CRISPR-associated endonuclease Cas2 [Candidatus Poribacteria bacterium]|nr:MAG: CRISPR-associated endonuclease Cas2 [Candidatus Poribacteria bacterium]
MFVVVSYDIRDDKRRQKICDELKNYGDHVQYSVFECDLTEEQIKELQSRLGKLINRRQDSIRYYFLCGRCASRIQIQGRWSLLD